jgi:very-short-patch-repair endonuclease
VLVGHDRYQLPGLDEALSAAAELRGAVSHLSAAAWHGWEVAFPPSEPWLTVPPNAKIIRGGEDEVGGRPQRHLFWAPLPPLNPPVTPPLRTVLDCARRLAFGPALTVADSALRHETLEPDELVAAATEVRGKGAAQARRVAHHASGLAANPFESMLRAIALECGLDVRPQVGIRLGDVTIHPDVVDEGRRIALEADSWEFHTGRDAHARDCWRYTKLVVEGWIVLRFTWRQVMHEPDFVRDCLLAVARRPPQRENVA